MSDFENPKLNRRDAITAIATMSAASFSSTAKASNDSDAIKVGHRFKDKVVLITGGTSGMGKTGALMFAMEGAKVFFNGRRKEKGLAVEKMIREKGGEATFFQSDVSIETQVQNFVAAAVKKYGKIDIAYNNAGIVLGRIPIHQQTLEQWNKIHSINSTGVFLCMKYELQQMLKQKAGGSIINVSSTVGHSGFSKLPDYTSTKHSVCGLTRAAAVMYAKDNIRINAISPSDVRTPLIGGDKYVDQIGAEHPMGRVAEPEEIVKTVMFLASDDASYVNGETMLVTGAALTI